MSSAGESDGKVHINTESVWLTSGYIFLTYWRVKSKKEFTQGLNLLLHWLQPSNLADPNDHDLFRNVNFEESYCKSQRGEG